MDVEGDEERLTLIDKKLLIQSLTHVNLIQFLKMSMIILTFFAVESQPSNKTTIKKYETMAKQHMNQYFQTMKNRQLPNQIPTGDLIGTRKLLNQGDQNHRGKMVEYLALEFFGRLMESFDDFKDYCEDHDDPDCNMLNIEDAEMIKIVENLKEVI